MVRLRASTLVGVLLFLTAGAAHAAPAPVETISLKGDPQNEAFGPRSALGAAGLVAIVTVLFLRRRAALAPGKAKVEDAAASSDAASLATSPKNPPSLAQIFQTFLIIGLTAFGGGASAHIHEAVVHKKRWVDEKRFVEGMTVARIVPGTNVSNLAGFVGALLAGYRGALVAVVAVNVPGILAVVMLAMLYTRFAQHSDSLRAALHGLTAGSIGIMTSLVINAWKPALRSRAGLVFALLAFIGVGIFEVNMLVVLAVLMPAASFMNRNEKEAA